MKTFLKNLLSNLRGFKPFRVFVWTSFNAFIVYLIAQVGDISNPNLLIYGPFCVAFLNMITKYVNKKYFKDLGVKKVVLEEPVKEPTVEPTNGE